MRAIDAVGTLNPALQSLTNIREAEPSAKSNNRLQQVSESDRSNAPSTSTDGRQPGDLAAFKPVPVAAKAAEAGNNPYTQANKRNVDVVL